MHAFAGGVGASPLLSSAPSSPSSLAADLDACRGLVGRAVVDFVRLLVLVPTFEEVEQPVASARLSSNEAESNRAKRQSSHESPDACWLRDPRTLTQEWEEGHTKRTDGAKSMAKFRRWGARSRFRLAALALVRLTHRHACRDVSRYTAAAMPSVFAIDFGTSNSLLAAAAPAGTCSRRHRSIRRPAIPTVLRSVLYFAARESAFGSGRGPALVDNGFRGRLIRSIKRHLPSRAFTSTRIGTRRSRSRS